MSAKLFNYFDDCESVVLECHKYHWTGTFEQGSVGYYAELADCSCPNCDFFDAPRNRELSHPSGLLKNVTPHILRHTMATTLLFNGCPIGFIKEILGHDNLETTCQYYLGVDKKAAKEAHRKYLNF